MSLFILVLLFVDQHWLQVSSCFSGNRVSFYLSSECGVEWNTCPEIP